MVKLTEKKHPEDNKVTCSGSVEVLEVYDVIELDLTPQKKILGNVNLVSPDKCSIEDKTKEAGRQRYYRRLCRRRLWV